MGIFSSLSSCIRKGANKAFNFEVTALEGRLISHYDAVTDRWHLGFGD